MQETKRKTEDAVRINKYLSQAGICSRRQADTYVEEGRVEVDGEVAVSGTKVLPGQSVTFDGKPVKIQEDLIFLAFHKPRSRLTRTSPKERSTGDERHRLDLRSGSRPALQHERLLIDNGSPQEFKFLYP